MLPKHFMMGLILIAMRDPILILMEMVLKLWPMVELTAMMNKLRSILMRLRFITMDWIKTVMVSPIMTTMVMGLTQINMAVMIVMIMIQPSTPTVLKLSEMVSTKIVMAPWNSMMIRMDMTA